MAEMVDMRTLTINGETFEIIDDAARKDIETIKKNQINNEQLTQAVEDALTEAKESGEFDGPAGKDGEPGKSAYEYAKDGGYTGSEADFIKLMNSTSAITYTAATKTLNFSQNGKLVVSID